MAVQAFEARDRVAAAGYLRACVAENPALGDTWGSVARLASLIGEVTSALTAARRFSREAPGDRDRRLAAAAMMATHGQVEEATTAMTALATRSPDDARLHHFIGTCRAQLGQTDAALRALRRSLALQRGSAAATTWLALADLKTFKPGDPDLAALEKLVDALQGDDAMQGAALYALGKAYDDLGETDAAFLAISRGAALVARQRHHDADAAHAYAEAMIAGADASHQARLPRSTASAARPIFVLGAPRSGSTLVEQILVSHSAVSDGAELNLFQRAVMAMGALLPADQTAFAARPDADLAWTALGEDYLHLLNERFGPKGRIVDKSLSHTRIVGLIASVLPGARFVWLRRDPIATAWSCLKVHFNEGLDWTWRQEDIARQLRDEDRLHAHWSALLPDSILTVPYESLVADPEQWIPRILAHCGLADEPGTRAFHTTRRTVQTASVSQVRRPLYDSSIAAWRRYELHLRPFIEAYRR